MITLAQTTISTKANPTAIFALWSNINNWNKFDNGIEWAKLKGDFSVGGEYFIKPKGGPKVRATILEIKTNQRFIDVSHLLGAKMTFDHEIVAKETENLVKVTMTLDGPLSFLWAKILGKNQQSDLEESTKNLIAQAEQNS